MNIRKATSADTYGIYAIYDAIHTLEEKGITHTGWIRSIYPTKSTIESSIKAGDMFVLELENKIVASARINREQVAEYVNADWLYKDVPEDKVCVLHTLTVDPKMSGKGLGSAFVRFYEDYAKAGGMPYLRMDTNQNNTVARRLYKHLGYREAGIVPCVFNGIEGVGLVCLEKKLED